MVVKFLLQLVLMLCGWCLAQAAFAAGLTITSEQDTVELGKPIWLNIQSDQTKVSLDTLDLSPWQDKVVLPRSYSANRSDDQKSQVMRFKVYPYHLGQLSLPGLTFLSRMNPGINIRVILARDAKQHSPIDFQCHNSTQHPWQQQQVIIACRISMTNAYAVFKQPAMSKRDDVQVFDIQGHAHSNKEQRVSRTSYELGWVFTPLRAGTLQLRLPPIQYVRDGVVARQFYLPSQHFEVRARPAWLPGTIPVGRVMVSHYAMKGSILNTGVLNHIRLDMQFDGIPVAAIPDYALQLRSDKALRYYATQRNLQSLVDVHGLHLRVREDIPVVATQLGIHRLPDLRLQYFDPSSGTLKTALVTGPSILVLNHWLSALLLLCLATILFWLLRSLWRYLLCIWRHYRTYQLARQQLRRAQSLTDIRQAMQTMAKAEGWSTNLTYLQWQARMQVLTSLASSLDVAGMNAASYHQAEFSTKTNIECLSRIIQFRQWRLS